MSEKRFSFKACKGTGFFYTSNNNYFLITCKHLIFPLRKSETGEYRYSLVIEEDCDFKLYDDRNIEMPFPLSKDKLNEKNTKHNNLDIDIISVLLNEYFIESQKIDEREKCEFYYNKKYIDNYHCFSTKNLPEAIPKIDDEVTILGFPTRDSYNLREPCSITAKIISDYEGCIDDVPMFKISETVSNGYSGSPVFLSKSITCYETTKDPEDLILLGVVAGYSCKDWKGVIFKSRFIDEITKK